MQALQDYLAMGGYAPYVWPAYGLTALVMGGLVLQPGRSLGTHQLSVADLERESAGES